MEAYFKSAISSLETYGKSLEAQQERASFVEAVARIKCLIPISVSIIDENERLLNSNTQLNEMRDFMTSEKVNEMMQEQAQTDPALAEYLKTVGYLTKKNSSEMSIYDMSTIDEKSEPEVEALKSLHQQTENAYQILWVIKERLNQIPKFNGFNPPGVRDVRNHLIEHVNGPGSGASIYSFGIATHGPILRPVKPSDANAPHDAGFQTNLKQFLKSISAIG